MPNLVDACIFIATANGAGDFVVNIPRTGWRTPAQAGAIDGTVYKYRAYSDDNTEWELGSGTYTAASKTLARTTIMASSNAGAKVPFTNPPSVGLTAYSADFATTAQLQKIDYISITQPVNLDDVESTAYGALDIALASKLKTDYITITQPVNLDTTEANADNALAHALNARSKTDFITITQPVNLDSLESESAFSAARTQWITVTQPVNLDQMESDTAANNSKVSFPEAPNDGKQYARKSAAWAEVTFPAPPPGTYIGDAPPAGPQAGQLWWKSDSGDMYIYYNDGNTQQWVQVNIPAQMLADYLPLAGGTVTGVTHFNNTVFAHADFAVDGLMYEQGHRLVRKDGDTMTGDLTLSKANPLLIIDKASSGQDAAIYGSMGGKSRWNINLGNAVAEGGSNLGSNFLINRFNDAGAQIDSPLAIIRSSGVVQLPKGLLQWPATVNLSTDPNTLDDYREGTWVPALTFGGAAVGLTYNTRVGNYTKIGNTVFWWCFIKLTAKGTSTGSAQISGTPFNSLGGLYHAGVVGYVSVMTSITFPGVMVAPGSSSIQLYNGVGGVMTDANFSATTEMYLSGQYQTAG